MPGRMLDYTIWFRSAAGTISTLISGDFTTCLISRKNVQRFCENDMQETAKRLT